MALIYQLEFDIIPKEFEKKGSQIFLDLIKNKEDKKSDLKVDKEEALKTSIAKDDKQEKLVNESFNFIAKMYCSDFFKLRKIRAKSGVKIKIKGK